MSPQTAAWLADLAAPISVGQTKTATKELARQIKSHWLQGAAPDAEAAFREHPELLADRSVALDLAYEEYCQRIEAGEQLDTDAYCERFSALRYSLAKQLAVHAHLQQFSGALELPLQDWPKIGDALLGFTLIEELGRGGFARVYLAREAALGERPVVVKITQQKSTEAQVLGRLRHRNVVPVYSVHHDPGTSKSAVCMPYLGRATLFELLDTAFAAAAPPSRAGVILEVARQRSQPNTPDDGWHQPDHFLARAAYVDGVVHLIAQVAEALHYTHSQGVCHGDLKPSNILLGWDGTPLLLDFNLSFDHHVADSALGGTIPYMSPEQLRSTCLGQRREVPVDVRSDVFSLAVILYELLTGKEPFGRVSWKGSARLSAECLLEQQKKGPRSLSGANPRVDQKLARVVERCLAVAPQERLQSAEELATALRRALSPTRRARRWVGRHRRLTAAAAALLLLFCCGAVGYVATLPPQSERWTHETLQAMAVPDWGEAVACASHAVECDPDNAQAHFLLGYAYQQLEQWHDAIESFNRFEELKRDGSGYASMAYCYSLRGAETRAVHYYNEAMRVGFRSAAVLNNLARHLLRQPNWEPCEQYLDEALAMNPNLQAAWHNRVSLEVRKSGELGCSQEALSCVAEAERRGLATSALFLNAARLWAATSAERPNDERRIEEILAYLHKAVDHGLDPGKLSLIDFPELEGRDKFHELRERTPIGTEVRPVLFADPIGHIPLDCWSCDISIP